MHPVLQVISEEPGSFGNSPWFNCSAAALPKGPVSVYGIQQEVHLSMEEMHPTFQAVERGCSNGSSCDNMAPESGRLMGEQGWGLFRCKEQTPVF